MSKPLKKVALFQMDCTLGDVDTNVAEMVMATERAAGEGYDLVVFPEMADTGYEMSAIRTHAHVWDNGPIERLREVAKAKQIAVIAGLSEREGDHIFNTSAAIDLRGELVGKYRKTHLISAEPIREHETLTPGDCTTLIELGGWKIGLIICYDLRFPELARKLAHEGAEMLVIVSAFPAVRREHWRALTTARAIENQMWVAACNRCGTDAGMEFAGCSRLIDPVGAMIEAPPSEMTLIGGEIFREPMEKLRSAIPVLDECRPELY